MHPRRIALLMEAATPDPEHQLYEVLAGIQHALEDWDDHDAVESYLDQFVAAWRELIDLSTGYGPAREWQDRLEPLTDAVAAYTRAVSRHHRDTRAVHDAEERLERAQTRAQDSAPRVERAEGIINRYHGLLSDHVRAVEADYESQP